MRKIATLLSLALALAVPGSALATDAVSQETLTVQTSVTVSSVPANISYGSIPGGTTTTVWQGGQTGAGNGGTNTMAITFGSNDPTHLATLTMSATDLTNGANTIPKTQRRYCVKTTAGETVGSPAADGCTGALTPTFPLALGTQAGTALAVVTMNVGVSVTNPAAGTWTGSITFTATAP